MLKDTILEEKVRRRLEEYRYDERELENQKERFERLESKMKSIGAQVITDMPRAPSQTFDKMSDYVAKKDELLQDIAEIENRHRSDRHAIEHILKRVRKPDERAVVRGRFIDDMSWDEVANMLFGERDDYLDKLDSYQRKSFLLLSCAVERMAEIITASKSQYVIEWINYDD